MVPTFILLFVLVNCGETFHRPPPPQLIEYPGFISALKSFFGFEKSQDERTEIQQQSEQLMAYWLLMPKSMTCLGLKNLAWIAFCYTQHLRFIVTFMIMVSTKHLKVQCQDHFFFKFSIQKVTFARMFCVILK